MDVLNKFYSTVSSRVSQLSTVLPGNPVTREYEVINHIASAGQGLIWKIYSGYKKSTHQEASIFVLEKRQLEKLHKNDREDVLECVKKGVSQLARLRHPQILVVQHTLEESRDSLAFATEPVFASLANILGNSENMPSSLDFKLFEVEIKYGLLQISEGLAFLHNDVRMIHRNISPQNIIVNKQGAWKIFGFDFCFTNVGSGEKEDNFVTCDYVTTTHPYARPDLDYLAPEVGTTGKVMMAGDIYMLGMLIYAVYNNGQPLYTSGDVYGTYTNNILRLKSLSVSDLFPIAEDLREIVRLMLSFTPELRPDIHEFMKINFFEDVGVKSLNYLDSLFQWDNLQKSQFYKGLPQVIEKLPHRVCLFSVIPCLAKEFVNPTMVPFVLPSVFTIAENCSKEEFTNYILSQLKPVMRMQDPIQILLICMQKMELLLKLTPAEDIKSDVLPMLFRALESDAQQIQELCLSVLPTFASLIEYQSMKNALIPRIKKLCIYTSYVSVRVNCLLCVGKLMEHLDKWLILDDIIPFLPQIPSKEPAVLMSIIGIYKMVLGHKKISMPKEIICGKVLPFLIPFCIENSLTLNQFNAVISLIKEMINRVENEQRAKLEQLNSIQEQQKSLDSSFLSTQTNGIDTNSHSTNSFDDEFQNIFNMKNMKIGGKPSAVSKEKTLTLEDKQRLLQQTDMYRRIQKEPVIIPQQMPSPSKLKNTQIPPVKDLTSSLIDSNLVQMKQTHTSQASSPLSNLPPSTSSVRFPASNSTFSSLPSFPPATTYASFVPSTLPVPAGNHQTTFPNVNMQLHNLNKSPSASLPPWNGTNLSPSAFFTSNPNYNKPISQSEQTKPLTSSEIIDFLN